MDAAMILFSIVGAGGPPENLLTNLHLSRLRPFLQIENTGRIFTLLTGSTALRFTATGAPVGARRLRILPITFE
jgi:hypothetical protein